MSRGYDQHVENLAVGKAKARIALAKLPTPGARRVPQWLKDATAAGLLEQGLPAGLLALHHDLVLAAEQGFGRPQYLAAARIVKFLLTDVTLSPVRDGRVDVTVQVHAAIEEILIVLRAWDPSTLECNVQARFALAAAWESHVDAEVQTAIRRAVSPNHTTTP